MNPDERMPARTVIGYSTRRFIILPDEITTFLIECDKIGLKDMAAITTALREIMEHIERAPIGDQGKHSTLILELIYMMTGAVNEDL